MNRLFEDCYDIFNDVMKDYQRMRQEGYDDFDSYEGYIPGCRPGEDDDPSDPYDPYAGLDGIDHASEGNSAEASESGSPAASVPQEKDAVKETGESVCPGSVDPVGSEIAAAADQAYTPPVSQESDDGGREDQLQLYRADELMNLTFPKRSFIIETLLSPGLAVLAGSPKVGKSWLVLQLCLRVAKNEKFLNRNVRQGHVLYFALEDTPERVKKRIIRMEEDGSDHLHIATACAPLGKKLQRQIEDYIRKYPATGLIVIDTFQKIRPMTREMSYANDYAEVSDLKGLADALGVCILLVHHTRKLADSDCMNEISGTNGIAGSADTLMVLKKESRSGNGAVLSCTGRDISDREMKLRLNRKTCVWELISDSYEKEDFADAVPPPEIDALIDYMKEIGEFCGTNTEFTEGFCKKRKLGISPSGLKRMMNRYRLELADAGVFFESRRTALGRRLGVMYREKYIQKQ